MSIMLDQAIVQDPASSGFAKAGWAVRRDDGGYLREIRLFNPGAGIVTTRKDLDALVLDERATAQRLANRLNGEIAEVLESLTQRFILWGDCIPESSFLQ